MRTFDKGQVVENELSFDEAVEDYCELAVIERIKEVDGWASHSSD